MNEVTVSSRMVRWGRAASIWELLSQRKSVKRLGTFFLAEIEKVLCKPTGLMQVTKTLTRYGLAMS